VVAVSDYMRAVQDQISRWVPNDYTSLGTDGWGLADTRAAARRNFQVDAESIVVATLAALAKSGDVKPELVAKALEKYQIDDPTAVAHVQQEGAGA
jgi:pyruvate dehydrogenase E1 component